MNVTLKPPVPLHVLSPIRLSILLYVATYWQRYGHSPTYREIAETHQKPLATIQSNVAALLISGFLERTHPRGSLYLRLAAWQEAPVLCPTCGKPMRVYAVNVDRPDVLSAECHNRLCDRWMVTLPLTEHATMTPERLAGYARVNARRRQMVDIAPQV